MTNNIGLPFFSTFETYDDLEWQMSRAEKYCLIELLMNARPDIAIEIGTYQGGSLQVLSKFSGEVYTIDVSEAPKKKLERRFENVSFIIGNSAEVLPQLFLDIERKGKKLEFIIVDGDHSKKGVSADLKAILEYPHKNKLTVVLHDSFNPQCRAGIKSIDYLKYKNVEYVELDYITGSYWHNNTFREMWGGLALIKLNPDNNIPANINQSQKKLHQKIYLHSAHLIKDKLQFLSPVKKKIYKMIGRRHISEMYDSFD